MMLEGPDCDLTSVVHFHLDEVTTQNADAHKRVAVHRDDCDHAGFTHPLDFGFIHRASPIRKVGESERIFACVSRVEASEQPWLQGQISFEAWVNDEFD